MAADLDQLDEELELEQATEVDEDVEAWAMQKIREFRRRKRRLQRPNAFENHVLDYIETERTRLKNDERDREICGCSRLCAIKLGRIPGPLKVEENYLDGVSRLKQQHRGRPHVIIEAAKDYDDYYDAAVTAAELAKLAYRRNEIPSEDAQATIEATESTRINA
jgi:hypothetical protein